MKINCVQNGVELPAYVLPCMSFREPAVIFNKFLIFLFGDRTVFNRSSNCLDGNLGLLCLLIGHRPSTLIRAVKNNLLLNCGAKLTHAVVYAKSFSRSMRTVYWALRIRN